LQRGTKQKGAKDFVERGGAKKRRGYAFLQRRPWRGENWIKNSGSIKLGSTGGGRKVAIWHLCDGDTLKKEKKKRRDRKTPARGKVEKKDKLLLKKSTIFRIKGGEGQKDGQRDGRTLFCLGPKKKNSSPVQGDFETQLTKKEKNSEITAPERHSLFNRYKRERRHSYLLPVHDRGRAKRTVNETRGEDCDTANGKAFGSWAKATQRERRGHPQKKRRKVLRRMRLRRLLPCGVR